MKNKDKISEKALDGRIRRMVVDGAKEPSRNPWMVKKVLNRLPPHNRPVFGIVEIIGMLSVVIALGVTVKNEMVKLAGWNGEGEFDFSILAVCLVSALAVVFYAAFTMLRRC